MQQKLTAFLPLIKKAVSMNGKNALESSIGSNDLQSLNIMLDKSREDLRLFCKERMKR